MKKFLPFVSILALTAAISDAQSLYLNRQRGFAPFQTTDNTSLTISSEGDSINYEYLTIPDDCSGSFQLDFRLSNLNNAPERKYFRADDRKETHSYPGWFLKILFTEKTGSESELKFHFKTVETDELTGNGPEMTITASIGHDENILNVESGMDPITGMNSFRIRYDNGFIYLSGGNRRYNSLFSIPVEGKADRIGFGVEPDGKIAIPSLSLVPVNVADNRDFSKAYVDSVITRSSDPLTGYWAVLDRSLDESFLRHGGDYTLAVINEENNYRIIYISGAEKQRSSWKTGMTKGWLTPTPFKNLFNARWIDSTHSSLPTEIKATLKDNVLVIEFPYLNSSLRLAKISKP